MNFQVNLKTIKLKGYLAYEYNPFRNYRLTEDTVFYDGKYWKIEDFIKSDNVDLNEEGPYEYVSGVGIKNKSGNVVLLKNILKDKNSKYELHQKGELVDFISDELKFSLNNPVQILPLWSYDNSVNLIINDGINPPKIINSRFSPTEKNLYLICDRTGDNDTNIYDSGDEFDIDTSLYKKTTSIPSLSFLGTIYGGNLKIGNYHFYFKYVDDDGNESDFFAESGLVSIFIGNSPFSIHSGFRDQNSNKLVRFLLSDTDINYNKIIVYYTKSSSDVYENASVSAFRIETPFKITKGSVITITGYEQVTEVSLDDINMQYQIYGACETHDSAQNILFLGNLSRPEIDYNDLLDCALRFTPFIMTEDYNNVSKEYLGSTNSTYYDPLYIYNKVGYWPDEIYRIGVVFIKNDNTLTEVFNVRGINNLSEESKFSNIEFQNKETKKRIYINFDEINYNITDSTDTEADSLENARGVIKINSNYALNKVIGIQFKALKEMIEYLPKIGIKGFFFVRLKRIPTTICLAYTIGIDNESHTPVFPLKPSDDKNKAFFTEGFLDQNTGSIVHDLKNREIILPKYTTGNIGAICPEYDVNSPYLNTLFSASDCICRPYSEEYKFDGINRMLYVENLQDLPQSSLYNIKVIGVEDNTKLVTINDVMFSARAGEAEEGFRYEYAGKKLVDLSNKALLRASYGPYLGITGYSEVGKLIDIKIPGYTDSAMNSYFSIRYSDKSSYLAISDRILIPTTDRDKLKLFTESGEQYIFRQVFYRGDCYISLFTHRINRNFQDPSAPTNDLIVDPNCWKNNFTVSDGVVSKEKFDSINLGDLNAVLIGMYITLTVRSTMNLNIRSLDDSVVDEVSLFGHSRGFFPYYGATAAGSYKIPEALCYNKGFEKSLSERYNFQAPEVPWIKNEFSNRIAYSNILVLDAFQNGWRTFMGTHYRDYPKTYGSITKIVEFYGNLLCIFEHGIGLIPVNERAVAGEGSGGPVYINTSNVLPENPKIISDTFGSQWKESIIKTPKGVYGVDTIGKKIWRTNGETFECISDFRVLEFLNQNISLTERELDPIIGIRNVKAHYNKFKGDVMFTFYDNLYGFEEKVWNLCWNENLLKWITFYSWVPSYSENIYNLYFSFDRNTSKWIAKLGICSDKSMFKDGVVLSNNIIQNNSEIGTEIGTLSLVNRTIDDEENILTYFTLERDNYLNFKNFRIIYKFKNGKTYDKIKDALDEALRSQEFFQSVLINNTDISNLCSELYERNIDGVIIDDLTDPKQLKKWTSAIKEGRLEDKKYNLKNGNRVRLNPSYNSDKLVYLLNIRAHMMSLRDPNTADEAAGSYNKIATDRGYYESVIAVTPKYNLLFLTTNFWKHGQAGLIDIADKIYPTYWYGKQHPFEFEFVVADSPDRHKIFDSLEIISNKAAPESFHYEIVGECYDFAKDKKNMYIRLEATKELYQFNGSDIVFNPDYKDLISEHRPLSPGDPNPLHYDKSTIFPLYYCRQDTINEIEDFYHLYGHKDQYGKGDPNFSALAGAEIVRYENLDEYRIWNHAKAVDIKEHGLLRGNMYYKEDKWYVQINPLNLVLKNETKEEWDNIYKRPDEAQQYMVPAECNLFPPPADVYNRDDKTKEITLPDDWTRNVVSWADYQKRNREAKIKDKFVKIRIRYSGKDLAIISAIRTLYSVSYA